MIAEVFVASSGVGSPVYRFCFSPEYAVNMMSHNYVADCLTAAVNYYSLLFILQSCHSHHLLSAFMIRLGDR